MIVLEHAYIQHLQQNSWFSRLDKPFQEFIIEHSKKQSVEKILLYLMPKTSLMVSMVF